jgi:hypothetical protein
MALACLVQKAKCHDVRKALGASRCKRLAMRAAPGNDLRSRRIRTRGRNPNHLSPRDSNTPNTH